MEYIPVLIVIVCTIGICIIADKLFSKIFRGKPQHKSGMSVRANKRYATIGLVICVLGVAALFTSFKQGALMLIAGCVMLLFGIGLIVYFLSFGIFYDDESFVYSTFGKKSVEYRFSDITSQQLYASGANIVIELYLSSGKSIQLQSSMVGVDEFLRKAFSGWIKQKGLVIEECDFYDPSKNHWFPNAQEG